MIPRHVDESTRRWIWTFIAIVAVILLAAAIGYLTGAWDQIETR